MEVSDVAPCSNRKKASFTLNGIGFASKKKMMSVGFQWYRVFHHEDSFDGLNIHSCLDFL